MPEPITYVCPSHGEYEITCRDCEQHLREVEREVEAEARRYVWWRDHAGIPHRYRSATPTSIEPVSPSARALRLAVEGYVEALAEHASDGRGLALFGPPGTGKTLALVAIVSAACRVTRGPRYASWPQVLAEVKAAFSGPQDAPARHLLQRLADAPLLALDELGVRQQSDFDHGALFELVDYRYSERLPTLVASNTPRDQLAAAVGERTADRLNEMTVAVTTSGSSQRGRLAIAGSDALLPPEPRIVHVQMLGQSKPRAVEPRDLRGRR